MDALPRFTIFLRSGQKIGILLDEHTQAKILEDWTAAVATHTGAPQRYDVYCLAAEFPYILLLDPSAIEAIEIWGEPRPAMEDESSL